LAVQGDGQGWGIEAIKWRVWNGQQVVVHDGLDVGVYGPKQGRAAGKWRIKRHPGWHTGQTH
jgi:hypothetical protein